MSSIQESDPIPYNIQVVNTYPQVVTCTLYLKSPFGAPTPGPLLTLPPSTVQAAGTGDTAYAQISYPPPTGGTPQTVSIPYGAPIDLTRSLNVLWNSGGMSQVIVIIETGVGGDE